MVLFNDIVGTFRKRCTECIPSAADARAIGDLSKEVGQVMALNQIRDDVFVLLPFKFLLDPGHKDNSVLLCHGAALLIFLTVVQHYFRDEDNKYTPAVRRVMRPYLGRPHPDSGVSLVWTQIPSGTNGMEWSDGGIRVCTTFACTSVVVTSASLWLHKS